MDTIDDVESALQAYVANDFPTENGERYLRIYGVMQGLFLQQDALLNLIKAINPAKKIELNDVLVDIREARNAAVGHPTEMKRNGTLSAHSIIQHSMRKEGFELHSYPWKDGKFSQYINVLTLIERQRAEATRILLEVVEDLREQEQAHRDKFRGVKLEKTFAQTGYAFEKIFEELRRDSVRGVSSWGIDHLQKSLDDFDGLLKERGLGVDAYDSIKYLYEEIRHPLDELKKFLNEGSSEVLSFKSAVVFASALTTSFDRLREIAREIDEEYESEPDPIASPPGQDIAMSFTSTIIGKGLS
jgi:hypothetical protein